MMAYVAAVQRGIDFVEARLDERFELSEVSRAARVSHWHFQRIFKALTGETLKGYVRARRLANALERLVTTDDRILAIALDAGFESQEAFTRTFKRTYGMTPGRFRKIGARNMFPRKPRLDAAVLRDVAERPAPELVERSSAVLIGLRTDVFGPDSDKSNMGRKLPALWDAFTPHMARLDGLGPNAFGVIRPLHATGEALAYTAAVPVESKVSAPDGLERIELVGATYAVFTHRGLTQDVDRTVSDAYAWLLSSNRQHSFGPDLEIYGPAWRRDSPESMMRYAIPLAP